MNSQIFIFGTGGHARDVAEIARALELEPVFLARNDSDLRESANLGAVELEGDAVAREGAAFAIGIGDNRTRSRVAKEYGDRLQFPNLVHPDTSLGCDSRDCIARRQGIIIFPGVRIMGGCAIGDFCTLNLNATVSHDCVLGDFVNLSPGAHIAGNVFVGDGAWIGMGAVVNQDGTGMRRSIGQWSVIGSGAVVTRDAVEGATYIGVPAREIES